MTIELTDKNPRASGAAVFGEKPRSARGYTGPERRRGHRRGHHDRRREMRFDMDKPDRRQCPGRRADDKRPKFW